MAPSDVQTEEQSAAVAMQPQPAQGAVGKHGAISEHVAPATVRAQILTRVAERRTVGTSLGDPVVRRRASRDDRPTGPRHRRPPPRNALLLRFFAQVIVLGIVTTLIVVILRTFVVASYYIPSGSMEPTLHGCPGCEPDLVMVERLSYRFTDVSRGDVVVFSKPPTITVPDKELIKRVIGLPGETISGHDGKIWIGTRPLTEPYVNPACGQNTTDFAPLKIPPGRYFMMGDNRCDSYDSRFFGTIAGNTMVGRAFAVIWPFKHRRWL